MDDMVFIVGLAVVVVIVLFIFVFKQFKKEKEIRRKHPGYPKGYWQNQGIAIGIAIGVGIGAAMDSIAVGIAIGVAIGVAIGSEMEKKRKNEIRPITDEEKKLRKQTVLFMAGLFIVTALIVFIAYQIRSGAI